MRIVPFQNTEQIADLVHMNSKTKLRHPSGHHIPPVLVRIGQSQPGTSPLGTFPNLSKKAQLFKKHTGFKGRANGRGHVLIHSFASWRDVQPSPVKLVPVLDGNVSGTREKRHLFSGPLMFHTDPEAFVDGSFNLFFPCMRKAFSTSRTPYVGTCRRALSMPRPPAIMHILEQIKTLLFPLCTICVKNAFLCLLLYIIVQRLSRSPISLQSGETP